MNFDIENKKLTHRNIENIALCEPMFLCGEKVN